MQPSDHSYRQLGRLAELKAHNENSKRFFGRDITNLDKRIKKNVSIYEKLPVATKVENRMRSRSLYGQKDIQSSQSSQNSVNSPAKDAIHDYKQEVMNFMAKLQKVEPQDIQKNVSDKMRYILIDWMVDVHDSFELKEQTLQLALNYLADYSSLREISKEDYQLVGVTCLWIASKYEEIYPPRTRNYIEVTADTYSIKDLKNMEGNIIEALGFDLNRTTALQLLEAMAENNETVNEKAMSLCKYAIETALFEGLARKHTPMTMVLAAMALCDNVLKCKIEPKMTPTTTKPNKSEVVECFKDMCIFMQNSNKYDLAAIKRKYGKSKYHQVSKIKLSMN